MFSLQEIRNCIRNGFELILRVVAVVKNFNKKTNNDYIYVYIYVHVMFFIWYGVRLFIQIFSIQQEHRIKRISISSSASHYSWAWRLGVCSKFIHTHSDPHPDESCLKAISLLYIMWTERTYDTLNGKDMFVIFLLLRKILCVFSLPFIRRKIITETWSVCV